MAWYDVVTWKHAIEKHSRENTYKALIRGIVTFCETCPYSKIYEMMSVYSPDIIIREDNKECRIAACVYIIQNLISNNNYMSLCAYEYLNMLIKGISDVDDTHNILVRYKEHVHSYISHHVPVWYARALKENKLSILPKSEYTNTCYNVNMKSVEILHGLPIFDEWMICVYNQFEDGEEYRNLLHRTFENTHRTIGDINLFIRELLPNNAVHLRVTDWMLFARSMGYDTLLDFAIQSGIGGELFAMSSIPLEELLDVIEGAREAYYEDNDVTRCIPDEIQEGEIFDDDGEPYICHGSEKFYIPQALARGISRRPDITYEVYETVLRNLSWWEESSPEPYIRRYSCEMPLSQNGIIDAMFLGGVLSTTHEAVFRDFIENKSKWEDNMIYCRDNKKDSCEWNNFCIALSNQRFLTLEDVKDMEMIDWDWEDLSRNPSIATPENILTNSHLPWVWGRWGISASPGITEKFVIENWEKGINFGSRHTGNSCGTLSNNHSVVTPELIDSLPDMSWSFTYNGISPNPNITLPWFLKTVREREWDMDVIVANIKPDSDVAIRAIQAWWRLIYSKRQCAKLASEVQEWWYSPDCKPASKIRNDLFLKNWRECV
jgi:hypothetical protein